MPNVFKRLWICCGLLLGLRRHDFRAAKTWLNTMYPGVGLAKRLYRFACWSIRQMLIEIPESMRYASWQKPVKKKAFWLEDINPHENHPWRDNPAAKLPQSCHVAVIGGGFTGAAAAYHWAQNGDNGQTMAILEMEDVASGSSGRNEGLVVMGRYYGMVYGFVLDDLKQKKTDLGADQQDRLARQFAAAYCAAAYKNADMIETTIQREEFDCDYVRSGWIVAVDPKNQGSLDKAVSMAQKSGFTDWTRISPEQVMEKSGMQVECDAAFSKKAASIHPAKWVWCLFTAALRSKAVELYTRTKVLKVEDVGSEYVLHTNRGNIRAKYVINATEAYSAKLHPQLHDIVRCHQTQGIYAQQGLCLTCCPEALARYMMSI